MSNVPDSDSGNKELIAKLSATADEIVIKSKNVEPDKTFAANLTKYHNEILVPLASELKVDSTPVVATSPTTIDNVKTLTSGIIAALGSSSKLVIASGTIDKIAEFFDQYNYSLSNGNLAYDPIFFEPQEVGKLGCGRHALNNLLGGKYFKASDGGGAFGNPDGIKSITANIHDAATVEGHRFDLSNFCKYIQANDPILGNNVEGAPDVDTNCPANEYYSASIILAVLPLIGYEIDKDSLLSTDAIIKKKDAVNVLIDKEDTLGLIINTSGPDHWWTIRKYKGGFVLKDSLVKDGPKPYSTFNKCWTTSTEKKTLVNVIAVKNRDINVSYKANIKTKIRFAMKSRKGESYTIDGNDNKPFSDWLSMLDAWLAGLDDAAIIKRLYDGEINTKIDLVSTHNNMKSHENDSAIVDKMLMQVVPISVAETVNTPGAASDVGNLVGNIKDPDDIKILVESADPSISGDFTNVPCFITTKQPTQVETFRKNKWIESTNQKFIKFWYVIDDKLNNITPDKQTFNLDGKEYKVLNTASSEIVMKSGGRRRTHKNRRRITKRRNKKGGKTKKH